MKRFLKPEVIIPVIIAIVFVVLYFWNKRKDEDPEGRGNKRTNFFGGGSGSRVTERSNNTNTTNETPYELPFDDGLHATDDPDGKRSEGDPVNPGDGSTGTGKETGGVGHTTGGGNTALAPDQVERTNIGNGTATVRNSIGYI